MRRTATVLFLAFVVMAAMATAAFASSVHLKGGAHAEPAFTDGGLFLEASGALAGLVNRDATGNATATCTNPGSGVHQPPGQNPAPITVSGAQRIPESELKNGTTPFDVSTTGPETPIPGAPGCPNSNWIEDITDLAFTTATITVEQPPGTVVLTVVCTFDPPTSDGPVPAGTVSCTSS